MTGTLSNQKGIALITTLGVVLVLLVAAIRIAGIAGDAAQKTSAQRDLFLAGEKAVSGIHLGIYILAEDARNTREDSLREPWADPETLEQYSAALGYEKDEIKLKIEDETGKIPINALLMEFPGHTVNPGMRHILERFFGQVQSSDETDANPDAMGITDAFKDWLDSNDDDAVTGLSGAESGYYESLEIPYPAANAPFDHVDDMWRVKGMDKEILELELKNYFTVDGLDDAKNDLGRFVYRDKININTAPAPVLAALLPEGRDQLAQDLVDFRDGKDPDDNYLYPLDQGWESKAVEFTAKEKTALKNNITYSSRVFRITCTAQQGKFKTTRSAVVQRHRKKGSWSCRILRWEHGV